MNILSNPFNQYQLNNRAPSNHQRVLFKASIDSVHFGSTQKKIKDPLPETKTEDMLNIETRKKYWFKKN